MKKVLFVCTGNTCRSPMAQAIFTHIADSNEFSADSCGIYADGISKISDNARTALFENGITFEHISKQVTLKLIQDSDIIICMTENHYAQLVSMFPDFSDKIFVMPKDICDPYGKSYEIYKTCYNEIYTALVDILAELGKNNG